MEFSPAAHQGAGYPLLSQLARVGRALAVRDPGNREVQAVRRGYPAPWSVRGELLGAVICWWRGPRRWWLAGSWSEFGRGWRARFGSRDWRERRQRRRCPLRSLSPFSMVRLRLGADLHVEHSTMPAPWLPTTLDRLRGDGMDCSPPRPSGRGLGYRPDFDPWQPDISRQRRRLRRLQQPRQRLQSHKPNYGKRHHLAQSHPTNPNPTHPSSRPGTRGTLPPARIKQLIPQEMDRGRGRVPLGTSCTFSSQRSAATALKRFSKKLSGEGYPSPPNRYATCALSSSISRNWSSTQSPGFRAKMISLRRSARSRRSSESMVKAR